MLVAVTRSSLHRNNMASDPLAESCRPDRQLGLQTDYAETSAQFCAPGRKKREDAHQGRHLLPFYPERAAQRLGEHTTPSMLANTIKRTFGESPVTAFRLVLESGI